MLSSVDYVDTRIQNNTVATCSTKKIWVNIPKEPTNHDKVILKERIKYLLKKHQIALVAHYYVHPDLQDLAQEMGGLVSDSLEMARFGRDHSAQTMLVAGVRFMGETAKILSPNKRILMPDLDATCSLDLGCTAVDFSAFCDLHPERVVVVYANTSAAVKARADWVVTSGCALNVVSHLHQQGKKIIWAPDQHLGGYIAEQTGADMLLWQGNCIVHDEFKALELQLLKQEYPMAKVLVHPESPADVVALADVVGSTSVLLYAPSRLDFLDTSTFIVATDGGMMHQLRRLHPTKIFLEAPTAGNGAMCKSCAHCPWMAMNGLVNLLHALDAVHAIDSGLSSDSQKNALATLEKHTISLDFDLADRAKLPIERMLAFVFSSSEPSTKKYVKNIQIQNPHQYINK